MERLIRQLTNALGRYFYYVEQGMSVCEKLGVILREVLCAVAITIIMVTVSPFTFSLFVIGFISKQYRGVTNEH